MSRVAPERVERVASLAEFFHDSVLDSMRRQRLEAEYGTARYVVSLLTLFARSEALFDEGECRRSIRPLALMLADAVEAASPGERAFALQRLGDVSLFIAGFFPDSLADKVVDVDYYVSMGGGAYRSLSHEVRRTRPGAAVAEVFNELAAKFRGFVDVLSDIRDQSQTEHDLLRLYELWLRTGSPRAQQLLRQLGIEPNATLDRLARH